MTIAYKSYSIFRRITDQKIQQLLDLFCRYLLIRMYFINIFAYTVLPWLHGSTEHRLFCDVFSHIWTEYSDQCQDTQILHIFLKSSARQKMLKNLLEILKKTKTRVKIRKAELS